MQLLINLWSLLCFIVLLLLRFTPGRVLRVIFLQLRTQCCLITPMIHERKYCNSEFQLLKLFFVVLQTSERPCRRRPSPNGWTHTCLACPVGSRTSTWTWGTDGCSSSCWRFCPERDWWVRLMMSSAGGGAVPIFGRVLLCCHSWCLTSV